MHPVAEDEASLAYAYAGFGVTPALAVVLAPLAVGLDVGAVDGDDFGLRRPSLEEATKQVVEEFCGRSLLRVCV
jgi:hypothetical protein